MSKGKNIRALMSLEKKSMTKTDNEKITCCYYRPRPRQKHCFYFLQNGMCFRPGIDLCFEWTRINNHSTQVIALQDDITRIRLAIFCEEVLSRLPTTIVGLPNAQAAQQEDCYPETSSVFDLSESTTKAPQCPTSRFGLNITINSQAPQNAPQAPSWAPTDIPGFKLELSPGPITTGAKHAKNTSTSRSKQYLVQNCENHRKSAPDRTGRNGTGMHQSVQKCTGRDGLGAGTRLVASGASVEQPPSAADSVTKADIDSFRALDTEVCIDSAAGSIWVVPRYTESNRKEFTPEHAAFLSSVCSAFPGSSVAKVEKIKPKSKGEGR